MCASACTLAGSQTNNERQKVDHGSETTPTARLRAIERRQTWVFFTKSRAKTTIEVAKTLENVCWRAFGAKQYYFEHRWRHLWSIFALITSRRAEVSTVLWPPSCVLGETLAFPRFARLLGILGGETVAGEVFLRRNTNSGRSFHRKTVLGSVFGQGRGWKPKNRDSAARSFSQKLLFAKTHIWGLPVLPARAQAPARPFRP